MAPLSSNEGMHQGERHGLQTRPFKTTQAKPGRAGYPNILSPLHLHPGRRQQKIPPIALVPPTQANRTHLEPPTPIKSSTKNLGICARPRHPCLHAKTVCADRMCGPNTRQAQRPSVMGHKIGTRFQPGHIHGTPPMFQGICDEDKSNKDQRHRCVQAPIHNKSSNLT